MQAKDGDVMAPRLTTLKQSWVVDKDEEDNEDEEERRWKVHPSEKVEKIFNDPIHGSIEMHPYLVRIIDTPEFQRLRYIRQMGSVYFVYPGASHNRFEHSIGVAHLASELIQELNKRYRPKEDTKLDLELSVGTKETLITKYKKRLEQLKQQDASPSDDQGSSGHLEGSGTSTSEPESEHKLEQLQKVVKQLQKEVKELGRQTDRVRDDLRKEIAALDLKRSEHLAILEGELKEQLQKLKEELKERLDDLANQEQNPAVVDDLKSELKQLEKPEEEVLITEEEGLCVQIAALCHDLGHGPFSHLFDDQFIPKVKGKLSAEDTQDDPIGWTHEQRSQIMLEELIKNIEIKQDNERDDEYNKFIKFMTSSNLAFIKELIDPRDEKQHPKTFLYEIVSNKRNGIDVDKMDYFARDCYHLGIENNFNCRRFFKFARVCVCNGEMQICMRDKEVGHIYDLYHTRNNIHQKACQHKVVKAIDTMIVDAFFHADATLKISDCARKSKVTDFLNLTDGIYQKILNSEKPGGEVAHEILKRIQTRDLYKCVYETRLGERHREISEDVVKALAQALNENPVDIDARITTMTYGMKGEDPIKKIKFYKKRDSCTAIEKTDVSQFIPKVFSEKVLHVVCKRQKMTEDHIISLEEKAKQWCQTNGF
ncbi:deoxynucleoside triphosphate triphosphohydrolase SAMHD1-like [Anguilla anguilla]|uniref:deoxynucleoside triphosphate triphosphohydrolase SAMHD1-like n=1 Tax=Anguilla anguilla TaxID=7936 RepID=UPI0015B258C0|nr:deoxynucleoside triphosphate triphosphohydrolase SAMHD1-like [Anguilla anguilla]